MKLRLWQTLAAHAVLIGLSLIFTWPFLWLLSTSLKVDERVTDRRYGLLPTAPYVEHEGKLVRVRPLGESKDGQQQVQLYLPKLAGKHTEEPLTVPTAAVRERVHLNTANYTEGMKQFPFWLYLGNTLVICIGAVVGTVLSCSLVAYGLACVEWKGREVLFWLMLSTMMLPGLVTMIPVFLTFKALGWINTFLPLVVPAFFGNAFFIFLLRQFYRSIPMDLIEAARLDGCSDLGIWARIMLPLSKPALAIVGLFTFLGAWNEFLNALIYLMDENKYTLSIGLAMFQNQYGSNWGQMMAMTTLMTIPIIVLFFFTQRTFIQGVKLSGIKG